MGTLRRPRLLSTWVRLVPLFLPAAVRAEPLGTPPCLESAAAPGACRSHDKTPANASEPLSVDRGPSTDGRVIKKTTPFGLLESRAALLGVDFASGWVRPSVGRYHRPIPLWDKGMRCVGRVQYQNDGLGQGPPRSHRGIRRRSEGFDLRRRGQLSARTPTKSWPLSGPMWRTFLPAAVVVVGA